MKNTSAEKPSLIFLHGFRGSHEGIADIATWLAEEGYDCHCPDIPPFGHGTKPLRSYTKNSYANFISEYIRKNNLKKPVLIGHSMGSLVAAATAEKYPRRVNKKMILISPMSEKPPRPIAALQPFVTVLPNRLVSYLSTRYLIIKKQDRQSYKDMLNLTYYCSKYYTSKKDVEKCAEFSASHGLGDFKIASKNILFIAGAKDRIVKREKTELLAEKLKAKALFIRKTGHLINYEEPKKVADAILDFLNEAPAEEE